jgi:hypothetical protein
VSDAAVAAIGSMELVMSSAAHDEGGQYKSFFIAQAPVPELK